MNSNSRGAMAGKSNVICCVPQCSSRISKAQHISLHLVPKEPSRRSQWQTCIRSGKPLSASMRVCSRHFRPVDFLPTDNPNGKRYLRKGVSPSQNLPVRSIETRRRPNEIAADRAARATRRSCQAAPTSSCNPENSNDHSAEHCEGDDHESTEAEAIQEPERRLDKEPSITTCRICSCHLINGQKNEEPTIFNDVSGQTDKGPTRVPSINRQKDQDPPPFTKDSYSNDIPRTLPAGTSCLPISEKRPEVRGATGGFNIFVKVKQIMNLKRQNHIMEQVLVKRTRQIRDLAAECKTNHAESGRDKSRGRPPSDVERELEPKMANLDALLVLRPDVVAPELRDLPPLGDLHTIPTTLAQATRMVFALRKDMLMLRNSVLQRALFQSAQRIEKATDNKQRATKQERLLERLNAVFTRAQQSHLQEDAKVAPWECEDYLRAISLRWLCRRSTFEYVRNSMKIPLPSMYSVRSMAACGLLPEVTKRYKELSEHKKLRFTRLPAEKPEQFDSDATEGPDPADSETPKRRGRGGGAGRGRKRKAAPEEEPEPGPPSPRKPCWDAVDLTERDDFSSSGEEVAWSNYVRASLGVTRSPRGRGRGRGRQRAGRTGPRGKREPCPAGGAQFAQEVPGHQLERTAPTDDVQTVRRGCADRGRPPLEDQKPQPGFSSVKRATIRGRGKSSLRGRGALGRFSDRHEFG